MVRDVFEDSQLSSLIGSLGIGHGKIFYLLCTNQVLVFLRVQLLIL